MQLAEALGPLGKRKGKSKKQANVDEADIVHHMLDSLALSHDAPLAEPPAGLKTAAKHYQLQGLRWMLDREQKGDAANR